MVNLILILIISMMPRAVPKVGQSHSLRLRYGILCKRYGTIAVMIVQLQHLGNSLLLICLRDVLCGFVVQAVELVDVVVRPLIRAVKVVECEEGTGVKVRYVVLL